MTREHAGGASVLPGMLIDPNNATKVRRLRTASWAALPLLALVYAALLVAPLDSFLRLMVLETIYCTPILLTIILSLRARALSEAGERTFWGALALANAMLLVCEPLLVYWVGAIDPAGPPRVSWPFHILHGIAAVSFIVALASLSRFSESSPVVRVRLFIDIVAAVLVLGTLALGLYVAPVMVPAGATTAELMLGTTYVAFGVLMVLGTVINVVGLKVERWRSWDKLFAVALTIYAIAVCLWPLWFTTAASGSRNYERGILDLVQFSGHWLLMSAALYRLTEIPDWKLRPLPPTGLAQKPWGLALAPAISLLGIPLLAVLAYRTWPDAEWLALSLIGFATLTTLALARSVLVSLESGALFHRSATDPLTGLYNVRFFRERLCDEVESARRYGFELILIVLSVDDYVRLIPRLGHAAAGRLLREVGSVLLDRCDRACVIARTGDGEFSIIAAETSLLDGTVLARRLVDAISISIGDEPGAVTASAGVASFPQHAESAEGLIEVAEGALFHGRHSSTDNVIVFDVSQVPDLNAADRISRLERQTRLSSVNALSAVISAQDEGREHHARALAELSRRVAEDLALTDEQIERVGEAALLHEVGALVEPTVPDVAPSLLEHEAVTSEDQRAAGQRILVSSGLSAVLPAIRSLNERWDGTGLPERLQREEIPIESRVLAVCDAYLMMTSGLESAHHRRRARTELAKASGSRFDPQVVDALFDALDSGRIGGWQA